MKIILKKIISLIITLLVISFVTFLMFEVLPGDAAISRLGDKATPERIEKLQEELGLDKPASRVYFYGKKWL